jgi:hypothetical protein
MKILFFEENIIEYVTERVQKVKSLKRIMLDGEEYDILFSC